jgi:hypothetical protein
MVGASRKVDEFGGFRKREGVCMRVVTMTLVFAALLWAFSAQAAFDPEVLQTTDHGCVVNFDTSGCFSSPVSTQYSGPTPTKCYAYEKQGQRCRGCVPGYKPDGQPTGKQVCGFVPQSGGCYCDGAGTVNSCISPGKCDYTG